ncbi:MAG: ccsA 3 [Bacteroidetes bacterium]|nr:ccsA 3 [Bacteroidota bacterium]
MKQLVFFLYVLILICLGTATFIEKLYGTKIVNDIIYDSPWFIFFWFSLALSSFIYLFIRKIHKRKAVFLLHFSFGIILFGAFITHFSGHQGMIHLRQGETSSFFIDIDSHEKVTFPFTLRLKTLRVVYYPGTDTPSDYISSVYAMGDTRVSGDISMNKIFSYYGYRFYQNSFDEDCGGGWFSVNYDPWGILISYAGYILLLVAIFCVLIAPDGGFRKLLSHPLFKQIGVCVLFLWPLDVVEAQNVLSRQQAEAYGTKQIIYNGRLAPFNTLARDFVMKLTEKKDYKRFTPEQILTGWMLYFDKWQNEPMIRIKSQELRHLLGVGEYARYKDFYTDKEDYRLQTYWNKLHQNSKQSSLIKAITEVDEKVAIINMLKAGMLVKFIPEGVRPLSNLKIQIEILYNKIPFSTLLYPINLTLGFILFLFFCMQGRRFFFLQKVFYIAKWILLCSFLFHTLGLCLRTYIAGHFPLSNGYETMQFIAWCAMLVALLLCRRFSFTIIFGFLFSGLTLLVASLVQMTPQITPLMPVLLSPLLSLHVSLLMVSYSLFGFLFLNGITVLFMQWSYRKKMHLERDEQIERLTLFSRMLLYLAVFFLGIGIFVGAVWANLSWGRYWAWDPKEVWALITFMTYSIAFHIQSFKSFEKTMYFHWFLILAFSTVLMTYFGVNYFLGGMHSYANN